MFTRGKGMKIYDTQDREYLDFSAGIAVNALGHADEGVVKVISEQVRFQLLASRKLLKQNLPWCSSERLPNWCTARICTTTSGQVASLSAWSIPLSNEVAWATQTQILMRSLLAPHQA